MTETLPNFNGLRIAAFESRRRDEMQRMIEKFGGTPFVSPSLREVPVAENREAIDFAYQVITGQINIAIFLTGVGFKHLLTAIEKHLDKQRFLDALSDIVTIVRGPKPVAAMREVGITPTYRAAEPNTWREVLQLIDQQVPVANQIVGLQEYGVTNRSLVAGLEARGAQVATVRVYQWELPEDTQPLIANVRAIAAGERDVLMFTSAHQVVNVLRMATELNLEETLRYQLSQCVVASIGPTTSEMLQQLDFPVDLEPEHSKMGHLVLDTATRAPHLLMGKRRLAKPFARPQGAHELSADLTSTDRTYLDNPFMQACRLEAGSHTPVWLMRQAGRYMSEYREVRSKISFLELCKNADLCAEVMVTAVEKIGVDAAIIFSDLLPILEPMGLHLEFAAGDGPVIHNPIRQASDVDRISELTSMAPLQYVADTVTKTRAALPPRIPVIGFAGSPFTLASYMIEGGSSRHYANTKRLMYADPGAWDVLMRKLAHSIALYLNAQIDAGAQCVQLFDSWAGCLSVYDYSQQILPYMQIILDRIQPRVPVINFATGNPALLPLLKGDRRTVVGIDWRIELDEAWKTVGYDHAVQGNLDPTVLLSDRATIRHHTERILKLAGGRAGHIFNLGHGILPNTPVENVQYLVDLVHELSAR
jgi:uroporphyrinogen decarboxylase